MNSPMTIETAYEICRRVTAKSSKTFYLSSLLLPPLKRQAIWAIYTWCRRTDDLVDEPQPYSITLDTLAAWEKHLEDIFAGYPKDEADVALIDTLQRFPLEIQPFRDMITGQWMDLQQNRYETFNDLYLYCYRVAGTVGLMCTAVMGLERTGTDVLQAAINLGIANQLTNILRDVGEDARRGRIYIPLEELAQFNYTEAELLQGVIDERWRQLMQWQIQRAKNTYMQSEHLINLLSDDSRFSVALSVIGYQRILDAIELNDYDVFQHRAYVSTIKKVLILPLAWWKTRTLSTAYKFRTIPT